MKALLNLILRLARRGKTPADAVSSDDSTSVDFAGLTETQQGTVRQYFFATSRLMQMVNCIRQNKRAIDKDVTLTEFRQAERAFIWAGFQPIFPPAVQKLKEFTPAGLKQFGLLVRLVDSDTPAVYSKAMDLHVAKLMALHRAVSLDSSSLDHLLKS